MGERILINQNTEPDQNRISHTLFLVDQDIKQYEEKKKKRRNDTNDLKPRSCKDCTIF